MKRFPELARRGVALALAASMSLSVFMPGALAADLTTAEEHDHDHDHVHLAAENSVDALGNEDFSDEVYNVPDDTDLTADADTDTDAADHVWGEWTEGVTEEGETAKFRVCEDCGAVELEDGTVILPDDTDDELELAGPTGPEWYPSDFVSPLGMDDADYAVATQGLNADGLWNYEGDYGRWNIDKNTSYGHNINKYGSTHKWHEPTYKASVRTYNDQKVTCKVTGWISHRCDIPLGGCHNPWWEDVYAPGDHLRQHFVKAATCTEPGVEYDYCGRDNGANGGNGDICRYIHPDTTVITPATGHSNADDVAWKIVTPATCTADGVQKKYCQHEGCGAEIASEAIPATGHLSSNGEYWFPNDEATKNNGWQTKDATCGEAGKRYRDCVNCKADDGKEEDPTYAEEHPATGNHTPFADLTSADSWHILKEATCTEDGKRIQKCSVCGHDIPGTEEVIPKLGHTYDKEVAALKPCQSGTFTCTRCNDVKTVTATKKHKYEFASTTQEHPCTAGRETWKCSVCGETEERDAKVAEHSFGLWTDDDVLGCQTQKQTRTCLVCNYQEHGNSSDPIRKHKYTRYVMSTPKRWVKVNLGLFEIKDEVPTPVVRADCDYGCRSGYDELNAFEYPKFAAEAYAATEASESVANTATPLVKEALADTKTAVNNAQNREEAIAALDQIYAVAKEKLLAKGTIPVQVDFKIKGKYPKSEKEWEVPLYQGTINVPITEAVVEQALAQLKNVLNDTKNMLNNSFLSEDAVKVAINKIVDTVANDGGLTESIRQLAFYPIYKSINTRKQDQWPDQATDSTPTETGELILRLAESAVTDKEGWQPFLDAIFDDLIDMLIEQLKKDPEYSKYLNNALGDELLEELRPKLREELVNNTTFVDKIRSIAGEAIDNAAYGVKRGWSDARVLAQLREDLLKVQDPVEQEMLDLSATIGNLVESSLAEKINKFLPFGDLTSWIGKWVGAFAKDKAVSEVVGETGKVRQTIEMYIKYITCGKHDPHTRIAQQASCTNDEMTERYCEECGWVFEKYKTGDAWGHTPVTVKGYEATETADGLTDGVQCSVCGAWIEPQEVIPAEEPLYEKYLVKSAVTADTAKAAGCKNQKKLDEAIDAALTKAGYQTANSERFLAQVQTSIGILSNDRYPEDGVTGMVKLPAGAAGKNCTFYAVQVLTADTHGYSAGDVVVTPLTVTSEGISFKLPVQSVVAIAWKVNE